MEQTLNAIAKIVSELVNQSAVLEAANKAYNASIISAAASILICIITVIFNYYLTRKTLQKDYSKTYKELITAERLKWLSALRESIADYLSKSYYILSFKSATDHKGNRLFVDKPINQELSKLSFLIKLRLNPNQSDHKELVKELDRLDGMLLEFLDDRPIPERAFDDYEDAIQKFSKSCQITIKSEWDLIKEEAKPGE